MEIEKVNLVTSDQINIVGSFVTAKSNKVLLCLHMMPATKESWLNFQEKASVLGYSSLAIDLRGHGESTMNGKLDYHDFSDEKHANSQKDVECALDFLVSRGYQKENIALVGASIGANLALLTMGDYPKIPMAVALSPGLNYHGITPLSAVRSLVATQRVLLCASVEDIESYQAIERLEEASMRVEIREYQDLGHGTKMLEINKQLVDEILTWIGGVFAEL